ncbi:PorT family protein [Reichenbachiella carrageenanivorans]|uniref:PorT family protein n=1 Tax=Reichenbachiella carrageenanivorans TaxID=2979869 RepID=A0ABY6CVN0_9BACT|nr:porin family protein [Reichenbachiella carrageenanivorans]UXX77965.1 PorT family protein [Reichenbachiella carrageenanivorans]
MKKATLCLLLLLSLGLISQADAQRKTYVGVKSGYNLSTAYFFHSLYGSDIEPKMEGGYQGGIIAMNYLRNHVGLQAELLYTQKGWRQEFDDQPDLVTELDYVELPLLVNIHTGKDRLHIFANGGCYVGYLVSSTQSATSAADNFYVYDESRDNKISYGFRGGVGAFYDFNFGTLLFESSFTYSLSDMFDPTTLSSGVPNTSKSMVVGFSVGYMFSFGEL